MFKKPQIVSHCAKIVFLKNCGDIKNEVFEKKIAFFVFVFLCWRNRNRKKTKKTKWKKAPKPYKNCVFWWSSKSVKISKKGFFYHKLPITICVRKGQKTRTFVDTICFGQKFFWTKTVKKPGNTIKIVVSAEIAPKPKMTPLFEKGVFLHG